MIRLAYPLQAFCVGCGRAFAVQDERLLQVELSPLGIRYPLGVCPDCKEIADEVEAAVAKEELTDAQKRYVGKQDEDAVRRAALADQLANLMDEVWAEEKWDRVERHIDQAIRLAEAKERARKREES